MQAASYDLRIGPYASTTTNKEIIRVDEKGFIVLEPGDIAVTSSLEILKFNASFVGRIGLRSKYARKGLYVTTGLQIDPGFEGRLFIGVINLTPKPVTLPYKDDFISIEIHQLDQPTSKPYQGPYQGKTELGPEDIEHIVDGGSYALSEVITSLQSLSSNVNMLTKEMRFMKWSLSIGFGLLALLITVVGILK